MSKKRPQLSHSNGFVDLDFEEPIAKSRKLNGEASKTNGASSSTSSSKGSQSSSSSTSSTQKHLEGISKIRITDEGLENQMFVDKYKPKASKDIIGQTGDRSNVVKLTNWLKSWHENREKEKSGAKDKKGNRYGNDDGSTFKAVLLSGPPGIGKTTSAQLICQEAGFVYKELNASDARNKRTLEEQVASLLENQVLDGFLIKKSNPFEASKGNKSKTSVQNMSSQKHALIMDEVDGMAGNEDRGGMAEMIKLIKETKIPIICICNDRNHQKIRSLTNHCFDLRFYKPRPDAIKTALMSIASKEGINIDTQTVDEIIASSNQDIRQSIHYLNMMAAKKTRISSTLTKASMKDEKLSPFEAIKRVFPGGGFGIKKPETFAEKCDLFFFDYNLMPLMVFENYNKTTQPSSRNELQKLKALAETADAISFGSIIEQNIRTFNNWSLLPLQSAFSVAIPSSVMQSGMMTMPLFPSFMGRLSNYNKRDRLLQDLKCHMNLKISGSKTSLSLDYLETMRETILRKIKKGKIDDVVSFLDSYYLRKEDMDNILELTHFEGEPDPYAKLDAKTKAALTRAINKSDQILPYSLGADQEVSQKKGKAKKTSGKKGKKTSQDSKGSEDEDDVEDTEDVPVFD